MANPDYFLRGSDGPVTSLSYFHPPNTKDVYILSGSVIGTVHVWYLKTRRIVHRLAAHSGSVLSIMTLDANTILTHGRDGVIHRWAVESVDKWTKLSSLTCSSLGFCAATLLRNDRHVSVIMPSVTHESAINMISISESSKNEPNVTFKPSNDRRAGMLMTITSIKLRTDVTKCDIELVHDPEYNCSTGPEQTDIGETFLAGYEDGSIEVFNVDAPTGLSELGEVSQCPLLVRSYAVLHENPITGADFCTATQRGVSGSADGKLTAWTLSDRGLINQTKSVDALSSPKPGIGFVRIRADGKLVVVGQNDGGLSLYGAKKMTHLLTTCVHSGGIQSVAFDVDNSFAIGAADKIISVWSLYKRE